MSVNKYEQIWNNQAPHAPASNHQASLLVGGFLDGQIREIYPIVSRRWFYGRAAWDTSWMILQKKVAWIYGTAECGFCILKKRWCVGRNYGPQKMDFFSAFDFSAVWQR